MLSAAGPAAAISYAIVLLATDPRQLLRPFGWWTPVLICVAVAIPMAALIALDRWVDGLPAQARWRHLFGTDEPDRVRLLSSRALPDWISLFVALVIIPGAYALSASRLLAGSLAGYFTLVAAGLLVYLASLTNFCSRGRRYYPYHRNRYIDLYDDPRSAHWVRAASRSHHAASAPEAVRVLGGVPPPRTATPYGAVAQQAEREAVEAIDTAHGHAGGAAQTRGRSGRRERS